MEDPVSYQIITADQSTYQVQPSQIRVLPNTDLALFSFESPRQHPVAILGDSTELTVNSSCFTFGFPSLKSRFSVGQVVANVTQPLKGGEGLACSAQSTPGMSGGPILNEKGHVIGINTIIFFAGHDILFTAGVSTNRFLQLTAGDARFPAATPEALQAPQTAEGYLLVGRDQTNQNQHQLAVQSYQQAIALDPTSSDAFAGLGLAHASLGNDPAALQSYTQAIQLKSRLIILSITTGAIVRDRLGLVQEAIADYRFVLSYAPGFTLAYHNRGNLYARQRDYERALRDYNQAIALSPNFASTYYNRGNVYKQLQNINLAKQDYETTIRLNPAFALAPLALGYLLFAEENWTDALEHFQQAERLARTQQNLDVLQRAQSAIQKILQAQGTG
ncbi:MAG: serine protease [Acaryochloridaceae cyanobacterium RL_2_7]|nr:serine protease [Acaryochloridaceae cyanobacterium RL_2_7]